MSLGEALSIALVIEAYALGSWLLLWAFFTRVPWLHLGTLFLVTDLFVMNLVILFTGGTESLLWPVYVIRVADQLFIGRVRALGMLTAALTAYGTLLAYLALSSGTDVEWGTETIKLIALSTSSMGINPYRSLKVSRPCNTTTNDAQLVAPFRS